MAALVITGLGLAAQPEGVRDGQIVLVPVQVVPAPSGPTVDVQSCSQVADGLRVRGWVAPVRSGQQVVAVAPVGQSASGVMVGSGYATRSGLLAGSPVGSFEVTLPDVAAAEATFIVAHVASGGAVALGPAARCPR